MPYYLAPYQGAGTTVDPFRPLGSDQPGWSAIDLRPDPSVIGGRCLLYLPVADANAALRKLADAKEELIGTSNRDALRTALNSPSLPNATFVDTAKELLVRPPVGAWKRLQAVGDRYEIYLGGLLWEAPVVSAASDDFNRANETPLASPWSQAGTTGPTVNLTSNVIVASANGDQFWKYAGAAVTASQYSQTTKPTGTDPDEGPACRITGTDVTGYFAEMAGGAGILKHVAASASVVQAYTYTVADGDTIRLEVEGSTLRMYQNGVVKSPAGTDTSIAGPGDVGVFFFESGTQQDNWSGGDLVAVTPDLPAIQSRQPMPMFTVPDQDRIMRMRGRGFA